MERILKGVSRFRAEEFAKNREFYEKLAAKQQTPMALFITCSDSRVLPNLITQTEPGDLFLLRNAGNLVPPYGAVIGGEAATIEYAVEVLEVPSIIICGHSQCGAMAALLSGKSIKNLPSVRRWCNHAEATLKIVQQKYSALPAHEMAVTATEQNVLVQLNNLGTHPSVAARLATQKLQVFGWYYDIGSGQVRQYEPTSGVFQELNGEAAAISPVPLSGTGATA